MKKQEALARLNAPSMNRGAAFPLNGLSSAEREEFVQQRDLFHRAAAQGMAEVRERHATLMQAGRMNEHFQLIDSPILL